MKHILQLLFIFFTCFASAQLSTGDMAFTAFHANDDDDFAMVTFVDIPANSIIYFSDKEWTGTEFNSGEANYEWHTGTEVITAGSIITFYTISDIPNVSHGTIVGSPGGISASSEAIFVYQGTDIDTPTTFITAVANSSSAYDDGAGTGLIGTGLTEGSTALTYANGTTLAVYNGPRTGYTANGYIVALNTMSNYNFEEAANLPFDTTPFVISTTDTNPPSVANVYSINQTTTKVVFTEEVTQATAESIANYIFSPALNVNSIVYDNVTLTATLTHSGLNEGLAYNVNINNLEDVFANTQTTAYVSDDFYYNSLTSGLIITEIMYNAPSDDSNALEFLEIYNNSATSIDLGGITVNDEGNFFFTFPEMTLASEGIVLLATDKATADAFYGVSFLDMPQAISNALGNGGELLEIKNSEGTVISQVEYSDDSPWPTTADGDGPSLELLNPEGDFNEGTNWLPATNLIGPSLGDNVYASPGTYNPITNVIPQISFAESTYVISEDGTSLEVSIELSASTANIVSINVSLVTELLTATETDDFTFTNQTIDFPANSTDAISITIPLVDDAIAEMDELFILSLSNPVNGTLGAHETTGVYIIDNDTATPAATDLLDITYLSSYLVDGAGSAEIVAHDPVSERLFVLNSIAQKLEIIDFSDINAISTISAIDLSTYGDPTSVAYMNNIVALGISKGPLEDGVVVFCDINGTILSTVTAGNLPDMVGFTPDGTKLLVANEGQPNDDYSVDPEGSISVIDVTSGLGNISQANVTSINFNTFDNQLTTLQAAGVRIFGPNASVSQDLEPEYISFSSDSQTAYVTLQENNAIGVIDLTTNTITSILPLGLKDHTLAGNTLDASDDTDFIFLANWPVKGMYMPDAMASYEIGGVTYLVTANEGDAREYDTFEEEERVSDLNLDPTVFPNAEFLKLDSNLGRLTATNASGDTDNDGDIDEIHVLGSRSFSVWNAATGALVFDSGDDFERITANDPTYGGLFNASNSNNNFKNRSDNKGPEPEGVTITEIDGQVYAFITLERVGGFMTYNITDPNNPVFEKYINNRDLGEDEGGDLGPEGIIYVTPENSPVNTGLVIMANEVSSTLSFYALNTTTLNTDEFTLQSESFKIYPNPSKSNQTVYFNQTVSVSLFDLQGREIATKENTMDFKLPSLNIGTYILKTNNGESFKLLIK
ncbi:choice-of-anchor I family protein [Winogradskyella thalassocola]|uniref:Por secretion system C-terminal sorting domain-containing protein n=1 Tax=Winogradskyella thalassocola TaxID=262004 RepID=A0A1G8KLV8_9FLAO|nr:choice-of-anchor I family protein [Winogradskyella thalassocola]SDI44405.1 Por secretion system C-terminal sorting domain-containing protein [Winogradskyella thalassocola]